MPNKTGYALPMLSSTSTSTRSKTVPFAADLAAYGDRVALVTADAELVRNGLGERPSALVDRLGLSGAV